MVDLRSDTVTKPTAGMLEAMMHAPLGDDVFGEDPTVNALEARMATIFGAEAGLFCPSGTMTNQIAIQVHTHPGDEVICHADAHVYNYEGGGIARHAACSTRLVHSSDALLHPADVVPLIQPLKDWLPRTRLVVAEDSSNRGGGATYPFEAVAALSSACRMNGLALHLDGARVFNAAVHRNHDLLAYGQCFDSISVCLSKGLGTPIGSVLVSTASFIAEARRVRKVMGGGMRQAGILAAAGLYALDHHVTRLSEDHARAGHLADVVQGCAKVNYLIAPETNILLFDLFPELSLEQVLADLTGQGVRAVAFGAHRIRMVTHLDVADADIEKAGAACRRVLN